MSWQCSASIKCEIKLWGSEGESAQESGECGGTYSDDTGWTKRAIAVWGVLQI